MLDADAGAAAVTHRVFHQVGQRTTQAQRPAAVRHAGGRRSVQAHVLPQCALLGGDVAQQAGQVGFGRGFRVGLVAGHAQRLLDHLLHVHQRALHGSAQVGIVHQLGAQPQRGNQRAQIVGDGADQLRLVFDMARQPLAHGVERGGQFARLARAAQRQRRHLLAAPHPLGHARKLADRAQGAVHESEAQRQHQQGGHRQREAVRAPPRELGHRLLGAVHPVAVGQAHGDGQPGFLVVAFGRFETHSHGVGRQTGSGQQAGVQVGLLAGQRLVRFDIAGGGHAHMGAGTIERGQYLRRLRGARHGLKLGASEAPHIDGLGDDMAARHRVDNVAAPEHDQRGDLVGDHGAEQHQDQLRGHGARPPMLPVCRHCAVTARCAGRPAARHVGRQRRRWQTGNPAPTRS